MLTESQKRAALAELKTEYLYIATPFILLAFIKLYTSKWQDIITSPEWALAACLIFGQVTSKLSKAVASSHIKTCEQHFGLYTAIRVFWVVASMAIYFTMLFQPSLYLGGFQIFLFLLASFFHFRDGLTAKQFQQKT